MDEFEHLQRIRLSDLRNQAVNDLIKTAYKRYYRKAIQETQALPVVLKLAVEQIGVESFSGETRGRKKDTLQWFITISGKDPIDHSLFFRQMEKCIKKQKLQGSGYYVLEQRSEGDQDPYGYHIHWLVHFETTSSKSVIVQQVAQCFQKFIAGSNYVDCRPIYSQEDWDAKKKYISGEKKPDKLAKVAKDVILRNRFGYPHLLSY